ncbi:SAV_915 family protein [Streptomyces sp. NPDC002104]
MCLFQYDASDSEPSGSEPSRSEPSRSEPCRPQPGERRPAGPLFVPARPGGTHVVVRLFRTPLGARTAVGFTSAERLAATLGTGLPWIRLSEAALRALARPLGASLLTVDPALTAPAVAVVPAAPPADAAGTAAGTAGGAPPARVPGTTARTA